jgi:hypothetical protein
MRKRANSRYKSGPSILAAVIGLNRAMRERLWERMAGMPGGAEGNSDQETERLTDQAGPGWACPLPDLRQRLANDIATNGPRDVGQARLFALNTKTKGLVGLRQKVGEKL